MNKPVTSVFVLTVALIAVTNADKVKFEDCGNHEIKWVKIAGCSGNRKCEIEVGKTVNLVTRFTPSSDSKTAKFRVIVKMDNEEFEIPSSYLPTDACKMIRCPLRKGTETMFTTPFTVPTFLPSSDNVKVTAKLVNDNRTTLACIAVNLSVKGIELENIGFF